MLAAIIFDVEGTLVDCVPHVLACWQAVFAAAGHPISQTALQRYSGMDGSDMLDRLLPGTAKPEKNHILNIQGQEYRKEHLPLARPFPGVRELFAALKTRNLMVGIATSRKADEVRARTTSICRLCNR